MDRITLTQIEFRNFLSFHDAMLPLKPLTVLVGPNACGKTNTIKGLQLMQMLQRGNNLRDEDWLRDQVWAGSDKAIQLLLRFNLGEDHAEYQVTIQPSLPAWIDREQLKVNGRVVIQVAAGKGFVQDEDGENRIKVQGYEIALKSVGYYGEHKEITKQVIAFISNWRFYDFDPLDIRRGHQELVPAKNGIAADTLHMGSRGSKLHLVLNNWHRSSPERFIAIRESLSQMTQRELLAQDPENAKFSFGEGYGRPIPLANASNGMLRLLASEVLLHEARPASLITLEEPDRDLHPGILPNLASLMHELAGKTQVIVTTHSADLLDNFDIDRLGDDLEILLLANKVGRGTSIIPLSRARDEEKAVREWVEEFGIGSTIFHSGPIKALLKEATR